MNRGIETKRDDLEDAILRAMYFSRKDEQRPKSVKLKSGLIKDYFSEALYVPGKPHFPKNVITFDAQDGDRLFGADIETTVLNPAEILDDLEIMIISGASLKWLKFVKMPAPRGVVAITSRPVVWFGAHYRTSEEGRPEDYVRAPVAVHLDDGSFPLLKFLGMKGYKPEASRQEAEMNARLATSIFEDSIRAGSFTATVEEDIRLSFPVGQEAYLDFLRLRDGLRDTPTGRKNPLIHWCAKHLRNSRSGRTHEVKSHMRGKAELTVGPMRLTLTYNDGSALMKRGVA